jgi:predicted NBD/HSP70 family sugar kinase
LFVPTNYFERTIDGNNFIRGNFKVVRNVNRALVLNLIRERQPISRVQIAKLTGLNKSTVSSVVHDLLDDDLIFEQETSDKNVGRNPIQLRIKGGGHFVGTINIDSQKTSIAVVDITGSLKDSVARKTEPGNPAAFVRSCVEELFVLSKRSGIPALKGIGVSVAGIVDPKKSRVIISPSLRWEGFDIGAVIKECTPPGTSVSVDNDSRSSALAELWFGTHKEVLSNFVFVSVGPGIGTGIVNNRNVLTGAFYASGEFGHMTLFEGGQLCACGNQGCWEAYACEGAAIARYAALKEQNAEQVAGLFFQDLAEKALAGELQALQALRGMGYFLGLGIANIVRAVDPLAIIIGGRITQLWELIYPEIAATVSQRSFFGTQHRIDILPTSLKVEPRLLGAATLAIKEIFSDYRIMV